MSFVVVDRVYYEVLQDMKLEIHDFYSSLFTEAETWRPKVDGLFPPLLWDFDRENIGLLGWF